MTVDDFSVNPATRAGDGFAHAGRFEPELPLEEPQTELAHGCLDGFVYIGHMVEDPEAGEETELFEAYPCRRCGGGE